MRAFILRRVSFVRGNIGDVVLIGSTHSADDVAHRKEVFDAQQPPIFVCRSRARPRRGARHGRRLGSARGKFPSSSAAARTSCVIRRIVRSPAVAGSTSSIDQTHGAGRRGRRRGAGRPAAAVYGALEGLDVLVIETNAPGGQAGSSSRIESYLGFPTGVSGQELAARAYAQAEKSARSCSSTVPCDWNATAGPTACT